MTYTEAAANNARFNLQVFFRDPKQLADGKNLRWFRDSEGGICYLAGCCAAKDDILLMYPVKSLKHHVKLHHVRVTTAEWRAMERL